MFGQKIKNWKGLTAWVDRAEERFEKESGWKSKDIRSTLQNFSRLNRRNQLLLGGLLVSRAVLGKAPESPLPAARKRKALSGQGQQPAAGV